MNYLCALRQFLVKQKVFVDFSNCGQHMHYGYNSLISGEFDLNELFSAHCCGLVSDRDCSKLFLQNFEGFPCFTFVLQNVGHNRLVELEQ